MQILPIKALRDNYIWLIFLARNQVIVVDPGDAEPVKQFLQAGGDRLAGIFVTHHHGDHIGGILALQAFEKARTGLVCPVYGSASIGLVNQPLRPGAQVLAGLAVEVLAVPGHTGEHLAYFLPDLPGVFCGDALFTGGCGRIFPDGHPNAFAESLRQLRALPAATLVYCAHEYTAENLDFAAFIEPENQILQKRRAATAVLRTKNQPTVPTLLALELLTNPFLRVEQPRLQARVAEFLKQSARMLPWDAVRPNALAFANLRFYKDCFDRSWL